MSLKKWDEGGHLSREVALYLRLQELGARVTFVTYGGRQDLSYAERLPGIAIRCNHWSLPSRLYEFLLPWLHRRVLRSTDMLKTNQTSGADIALRCARRWRKPLIARCGYMWSEFAARQQGADSPEALRSARVEREVFGASCRVFVTTEAMRRDLAERFPALTERIAVVPNYVDTELFGPAVGEEPAQGRLCYVGRLNQEQKNLRSLVAAVRGLDVDLDIVGEGHLREELEAECRANPRIRLLGRVPNHRLPRLLASASAYLLPSYYEGHPKALLEAMACAVPVIAANAPGIASVVRHGETGWLCETSPESIRAAIRILLADRELRQRLGKGGREFVEKNFSLARIARQELALYEEVVAVSGEVRA